MNIPDSDKLDASVQALLAARENLGIPRRNMPQIEDKHQEAYWAFLKHHGIALNPSRVKTASLNPIQLNIRVDVARHLHTMNPAKLKKPLIISRDHYIMDGHHRWLCLLALDLQGMADTIQVDAAIRDILELTREFDRVVYKDDTNRVYMEIDATLKFV